MNIEGIEIGSGQPCRLVAEISNNHNGSLDRALRLIDAAKSAGADFVKFQCYTVDELVVLRGDGPAPAPWNDRTMRDLYTQAMTPHAWFPALYAHAAMLGLPLFSSVFGLESLALLESVGNPCYKVARLDNRCVELIGAVICTGKPYLISADLDEDVRYNMTDHPDTEYAKRAWRATGGWGVPRENLLLCPKGYPPERVELPYFFWNDDDGFDNVRYLGLSSHCLDPRLPIAAVARGAKLLEYHFMLADEPSELEANVSLNQYQFNQMVQDVRRTEAMLA